jgi:predicted PurR-regulated permease PerM
VNAALTLIGLLILDVKFAFILASLAGVFSLVPIFGSIISTLPIALVGLMTSPWTSLLAILWIAGIHALEANFLNPKILGKSAQIHPVLVVLALISGEHFYGVFGALLAVPIASILLTVFQYVLSKTDTYA